METKNTKNTSFSINKEVLQEFNKTTVERCVNRSKWIELKMKEFIEENKKQ
jgi:metal-responsive CopG/Arc/MetJ family transcriptional regulator